MSDPGILAADRGVVAIERRLRKLYRQSKIELERTLRDFNLKFAADDAAMRKKVADKIITEQEYQSWLKRTVFRGKQWDAKVNHCTDILSKSNREALNIVRGKQLDVFAENATYQAYLLESGAGMNFGFGVYSGNTVSKLLKDQPELLPRKVLNGVKDKAWNKDKIANVVARSIVQGDDIRGIANRMADTLSRQNDDAMMRYARTAMTSAQNAGRMEVIEEANDEGIHTKKKWVATLDSRTRDTHQELDGQTAEVDEPFEVTGDDGATYKIMFPGDPTADPCMVYNCRCTLEYVIEGFENKGQRRAYDEWVDEDGKAHRKSTVIEDMTYKEWKKWKEGK